MAACGSLQHIFEKPLPENPTLLESLSSRNQTKPVKPIEQSSFTEIFGELHFKENSQSSSSSASSSLLSISSSFTLSPFSSPSSFLDLNSEAGESRLNKKDSLEGKTSGSILDCVSRTTPKNHQYTDCHQNGHNFSRMNYESLQLCTEGLGFESSDDVEYLKNDINEDRRYREEKVRITRHAASDDLSRPRSGRRTFPPPISCIERSGKPRAIFKSYRHDGRFVLKEVRMPTFKFLHACREDGRLTLQFVHPNDETIDEAEDEVEVEEDYEHDAREESDEEKGNDDDDG
ncbi:hypothetical protein POTOM_018044 [Populus tomentosa]|uniref:FAF domain-containing protein n=1 Tax=Populus tomentosa TaxID=118781 RepID=A0A8X8CW94_POPTO|nr:hypothetical protein POTOM_018044 [Populus tomentosa]